MDNAIEDRVRETAPRFSALIATYKKKGEKTMDTTPNYGLTLFQNGDFPSWLQDWNDNMTKIDTALATILAAIPAEVNLDGIKSDIAELKTFNSTLYMNRELFKNPCVEIPVGEFVVPKTGYYLFRITGTNSRQNAMCVISIGETGNTFPGYGYFGYRFLYEAAQSTIDAVTIPVLLSAGKTILIAASYVTLTKLEYWFTEA